MIKKLKNHQAGDAHIIIILVLVFIAIGGVVGYVVMSQNDKTNTAAIQDEEFQFDDSDADQENDPSQDAANENAPTDQGGDE